MPKKQTHPRLSSAAARLLAKLPKRGRITVVGSLSPGFVMGNVVCTVAELRSLLASRRKIDRRTKSDTGMTAKELVAVGAVVTANDNAGERRVA